LELAFDQRAKTITLDRNLKQLTQFPLPTGQALPGTNEFMIMTDGFDAKMDTIMATPHASDAISVDTQEEVMDFTRNKQRFWMSDQHVKACYSCDQPFTFCRRKHHCRSCGQIFCYQCCTRLSASFKPPHESVQYLRKQLVCHPCHSHLREGLHLEILAQGSRMTNSTNSKVTTTKKALAKSMVAPVVTVSPPTVLVPRPPEPLAKTGESVANSLIDEHAPMHDKLKYDKQLYTMFPRVQLVPSVTPAPPMVVGPSPENESTLPLRRRSESDPSYSIAVRKTKAIYTIPEHPNGVRRQRSCSRDDPNRLKQPPNLVRTSRTATELMVEALTLERCDSNSSINSSSPRPASAARVRIPHSSSVSSTHFKSPLIHLGHACLQSTEVEGLLDAQAETEAMMSKDADKWIHERILKLLEASSILTQLTYVEQSKFVDKIFEFAKHAAATIDVGDALDILKYIRIKCFPGGSVHDSFFVHGILCHKSVARKSMRQKIESPRILLVASPLDYQRQVEKLSSLESVAGQETEYMRIAVDKIRTLRPDIVLFQGHVHRVAEELLATSDIVVVKNLKLLDLKRLALVTGAALLASPDHVDKLVGETVLGECSNFRVWNSELPKFHGMLEGDDHKPKLLTPATRASRKRIKKQSIIFEGGKYSKGCTIALRGAAENVLKEVREILRITIRTAYHLRLQRSVLVTSGFLPSTEPADFRHEWFYTSSSMYLALNDNSLSMRAALKEYQTRCRHCKEDKDVSHRSNIANTMENLVSMRHRSSDTDRKPKKQTPGSICHCPKGLPTANRNTIVLSTCWSRLDDQVPSPAQLMEIEFYSDGDCTLLQFLSKYCFDTAAAAFKQAFRTQRLSFSHDLGRVIVQVIHEPHAKSKSKGPGQELLYMFNFTTKVVQSEKPLMWIATDSTPAHIYTVVPQDMLHYSFGKFIEDMLYLQPLSHDARFFPQLPNARDPSLVRYFACSGVVVSFTYEPIHPVLHLALRPALWGDDPVPAIDIQDIEELVHVADEVLEMTTAKIEAALEDLARIAEMHGLNVQKPETKDGLGKDHNDLLVWHKKTLGDLRIRPPADVFEKQKLFREIYEMADKMCIKLQENSNSFTFKEGAVEAEPAPNTLPGHWFDVTLGGQSSSAFGLPLEQFNSEFADHAKSSPLDIARSFNLNRVVDDTAGQKDFVMAVQNGEIPSSSKDHFERFGQIVVFPEYSDGNGSSVPDMDWSHDGSSLSHSHSFNRTQIVGTNAIAKKGSTSFDQSHLFVVPKSLLCWHPSLPKGVNDTVVLVNTSQPTSAVAYSLCSVEYTDQLNESFSKQGIDIVLGSNMSAEDVSKGMLQALRSDRRSNVDHLFVDENNYQPATKFSCKSYYATQFYALRQLLYKDQRKYIESLCKCELWNASGGKSGAGFVRTKDERFVCKVIPSNQLSMFLNMASSYFEYMAKMIDENLPTMLGKIVGVYRITITDSSSESTLCLLAMENLVYGRRVDYLYDLKGKLEGRFIDKTDHQVLWDRNFVKMTKGIPLPMQESAMILMKEAILHDTAFLSSQDVTDYSLLIGYDHEKQEIIAGIIDYIVKYDLLKRLEHHGKRLLQDEGEITILNPKQYTKRFRTAMAKYFTAVPSRYTMVAKATTEND
ncbi:Phosphatidylinositol-3-phosphate5- kinase (Fab-like, PIPK-A1), partial [Thraustotheca clavata]